MAQRNDCLRRGASRSACLPQRGSHRGWLQRTYGYTLVELLVVLAVLAAAGALAVPLIVDESATRVKAGAAQLVADLQYAQVASLARSDDPCCIVFSTAQQTYTVARSSAPATPLTDPSTHSPYVVVFGSGRASAATGVQIESASSTTLGFTSMGALTQASSATVTLTCKARRVTVSIDASTGRASVGTVQ
ncbi:MAG: prepilin-type N-terminal cleavage/methylation domain-containing protein [Planctomycetota bacterium]|nr:prepilin-type N-terminal cleavage/methylation domain-containing protein [Planctomycetota bacterium]